MLTHASLAKFAVFNWTNPALRDWWVYTYVGGALNETAIDGVYLDCACRALGYAKYKHKGGLVYKNK